MFLKKIEFLKQKSLNNTHDLQQINKEVFFLKNQIKLLKQKILNNTYDLQKINKKKLLDANSPDYQNCDTSELSDTNDSSGENK